MYLYVTVSLKKKKKCILSIVMKEQEAIVWEEIVSFTTVIESEADG